MTFIDMCTCIICDNVSSWNSYLSGYQKSRISSTFCYVLLSFSLTILSKTKTFLAFRRLFRISKASEDNEGDYFIVNLVHFTPLHDNLLLPFFIMSLTWIQHHDVEWFLKKNVLKVDIFTIKIWNTESNNK